MTITMQQTDSTITLKLTGWLDVQTTPELQDYMKTVPETEKLVFDFDELEYISSSGVREVVSAYRRQKTAGGSFAVINVRQEVMDVFAMTGINKKIDISGK